MPARLKRRSRSGGFALTVDTMTANGLGIAEGREIVALQFG